ncbi:hypothetical protein [Cerasicoccus maritimus]|nr:hypothetical protein [Cerasicoccus maritimus]
MPDAPKSPELDSANAQKRPWPMTYILIAIGLFIGLFNLYLLLSAE